MRVGKIRNTLAVLITGATVALLAGCGGQTASAGPAGTAAAASTTQPGAQAAAVHLYLSILTGKMVGKKGWPEFVPADFTLPAHTVVEVTIRDFDDGTAPLMVQNDNQVQGTVGGTMELIPAVNGNVDRMSGQAVTQVAAKDAAHTFTFTGNGFLLNVPVPPLSTVRFAFETPGPGTYTWHCLTACGTGSGGMGGAMVTDGWMRGVMTVK